MLAPFIMESALAHGNSPRPRPRSAPECSFTSPTPLEWVEPFGVTSARQFDDVTGCPVWTFVALMSDEVTASDPVGSPAMIAAPDVKFVLPLVT